MTRTRRCKQFLSVYKAAGERVDYIATHFVATCTSRSADCDPQVLRLRIVFVNHSPYCHDYSGRECASPTRVYSRKGAAHTIPQQNRNAVGSLDTCQDSTRITDYHIAKNRLTLLVLSGPGFLHCMDHAHVSAVYLPATGKNPLALKKLEKAATILQNVLGCVLVEACETQCIRRHLADAAETR